MPTDAYFNVRLKEKFRRRFPRLNVWATERQLNATFDHNKFSLKPQHHVDQQHLTMCDALPERILNGTVIVKPNVHRVEGNSVTFDNGTKEDNIDAIILCTGYSFSFPFLTDKDIEVEDNRVFLYKNVFPPSLPHPTLAAIGLVQPNGAIMPVAEMQLRFACHLLANRIRLPSSAKMTADIRAKQKILEKKFVSSRRHTIEVNSIEFMDELASMIGCHPDPLEYLLNDPVLCYHLWMGPCTPYQYRLKGPNIWLGARKAIVQVNKRIWTPLQTAKLIEPKPIVTGDEVLLWWILHIIIPLGIVYLAFGFQQ